MDKHKQNICHHSLNSRDELLAKLTNNDLIFKSNGFKL